MPPRMGAWQPERLRYGAATKNHRVAERFPERKPARQNLRAQRKRRNAVWRFAMTSPPSGCQKDFHPQAVEHARHTKNPHAKKAGSHKVLQQSVSEDDRSA